MNVGDFIDARLEASGGQEPYAWAGIVLPPVLGCRNWGAICGVLAALTENGQTVAVEVRDAKGNRAERQLRLAAQVLPPPPAGFCVVPGGYFSIGYHPTRARDGWLRFLQLRGYPISPDLARERWPAGDVHVDGFYIQQYEVTNAEFVQFVEDCPEVAPPGYWNGGRVPTGLGGHPVVHVSFADAEKFCQWKTARARAAGELWRYRLPTHWQWEKAAKGATALSLDHGQPSAPLYPWGDAWGDSMVHALHSNELTTVEVTRNVGDRSGFGICGLAGNAAEWVDGGVARDGTVWKHLRGAGWCTAGQLYGLTFCYGLDLVEPGFVQGPHIGFRCVAEEVPRTVPAQTLVPLGNDQYVDGQGERQFIGRFSIARFAVSNDEFSRFKPEHRFSEVERWRPVTMVSHEEASAFCRWKHQHDGRFCRLPTRGEWERASRGTEARRYPWGSDYSRYRCNSLESGWGRTVDVHALWQGATPEGVYNLCGNTFEWLVEGGAVGGSWLSTCEGFGAPPYTIRPGSQNGTPEADIGFRYVSDWR